MEEIIDKRKEILLHIIKGTGHCSGYPDTSDTFCKLCLVDGMCCNLFNKDQELYLQNKKKKAQEIFIQEYGEVELFKKLV